jgi:hypothetical protein
MVLPQKVEYLASLLVVLWALSRVVLKTIHWAELMVDSTAVSRVRQRVVHLAMSWADHWVVEMAE